jgi:predicted dehydrogenase
MVRTINETSYDIRLDRRKPPVVKESEAQSATATDSVKYYAAVIRGEINPSESLSSLKTNLIAVEIIDAAKKSARTGESVRLGISPDCCALEHD